VTVLDAEWAESYNSRCESWERVRSMESGGQFCVTGALGRILALFAVKMFSHLFFLNDIL
jgi:hypothetical protein